MIPQHGAKISARYMKILLNYTSMAVGISAKYDSNISNNNMINNINIDDIYLDFLTVISRIITVTSYACRYLTVTTMENPEYVSKHVSLFKLFNHMSKV